MMEGLLYLICLLSLISHNVCIADEDEINLALNNQAVMSSQINIDSQAAFAVDGDQSSCAQAKLGVNQWFHVDLQEFYEVSRVVIFPGNETIVIGNFQIYLIMATPRMAQSKGYSQGLICAEETGTLLRGTPREYHCMTPHSIRYVAIQTTQNVHIRICELKVYGKRRENIALNKRTAQSSTHPKNSFVYTSNQAVDGDESNRAHNEITWSCSHTQRTNDPSWWILNLDDVFEIHQVVIVFRQDILITGDFHITIHPNEPSLPLLGNTAGHNGIMCATQNGAPALGERKVFNCSTPNMGSFLVIQQKVTNSYLQLCEVEVFGSEISPEKASCPQRFLELSSPNEGISSDCPSLGWKDDLTYAECIQSACDVEGKVVTYSDRVCYVRNCEDNDLKLTNLTGGWYIAKEVDNCWLQFKLMSEGKRRLKSRCPLIKEYPYISVDKCKLLACESKDGNTINYKDGNCSVLQCPAGDPQLIKDDDEWYVYQSQGKEIKIFSMIEKLKAELKMHRYVIGGLAGVIGLGITILILTCTLKRRKTDRNARTEEQDVYVTPDSDDIDQRSDKYATPKEKMRPESEIEYEDTNETNYENETEFPPQLPARNSKK